jgi:hypothetical protein
LGAHNVQHVLKLGQELAPGRDRRFGLEFVGAVLGQAPPRFLCGEAALGVAAQRGDDIFGCC